MCVINTARAAGKAAIPSSSQLKWIEEEAIRQEAENEIFDEQEGGDEMKGGDEVRRDERSAGDVKEEIETEAERTGAATVEDIQTAKEEEKRKVEGRNSHRSSSDIQGGIRDDTREENLGKATSCCISSP
jgi:phage terminase small subunit